MRFLVMVVEDHPDYAAAVVSVLGASDRFEVRHLATSADEALRFAGAHPLDLVVCDMHLPDAPGAELCRALRALDEPPQVCVVSADGRPQTVREALAAGAVGFVHKSTRPRQLVALLAAAATGEPSFDQATAAQLATDGGSSASRGGAALPAGGLDVLSALADGLDTTALATRLGITEAAADRLVESTVDHIGAPTRAAAVAWAFRNKLIS